MGGGEGGMVLFGCGWWLRTRGCSIGEKKVLVVVKVAVVKEEKKI